MEIVDTPSGQTLHIRRHLSGRSAFCGARLRDEDWIASPYGMAYAKDAGKPPCSRCLANFRTYRRLEDAMLDAYGFTL